MESTLRCVQRENAALRAQASMLAVSSYQLPPGFQAEFERLNVAPNVEALALTIRNQMRESRSETNLVRIQRPPPLPGTSGTQSRKQADDARNSKTESMSRILRDDLATSGPSGSSSESSPEAAKPPPAKNIKTTIPSTIKPTSTTPTDRKRTQPAPLDKTRDRCTTCRYRGGDHSSTCPRRPNK